MKAADRSGALYSLILGETELAAGKIILKNMKSGEQQQLSLDILLVSLKQIIASEN
jgi:histidyl-tRNA synthetase